MSIFDDASFSQSAAFGPQQHRKLEWNPITMRWEPTTLAEDEYNDKYAANINRGAFKTFGVADGGGPDTSTQPERDFLSQRGRPSFYKGSGGSLEGLRMLLAELQRKQAAKSGVV